MSRLLEIEKQIRSDVAYEGAEELWKIRFNHRPSEDEAMAIVKRIYAAMKWREEQR